MADPIAPGTLINTLRSTQGVVIADLKATITEIMATPHVRVDLKVIETLEGLLHAWEAYVKAISSSNAGYEFRDLDPQDKFNYDRAQHGLRVLWAMYGPKSGD
jgi:hypothetical protein